METLYNWLLHNTGNEGNYFTILNVHRRTESGETADIEVMVRTKEFATINLIIKTGLQTDQPINLPDRVLEESHFFTNDDEVVGYLMEGRLTNPEPSQQGVGVYVFRPTSDSGELSFPPRSSY